MSTTKNRPKRKMDMPSDQEQRGSIMDSPTAVAVRQTGAAAAKELYLRRRIVVCVFSIIVVAFFIWFLTQFIPRPLPKPDFYNIGELKIQSLTYVVGDRKVLSLSESLSGLGRAEAGMYTYKAGESPKDDITKYCALLNEEYGAQADAEPGESGKLVITVPTGDEQSHVEMTIDYNSEQYVVTLDEKLIPKEPEKPETKPRTLSAQDAYDKLMTLTKDETGFKAEISVYGYIIDPEPVLLDGWEYYVITIQAEYSETNIEYRGTFYVGCFDGVIMRYDLETQTASRVRGEATPPPEEPAPAE